MHLFRGRDVCIWLVGMLYFCKWLVGMLSHVCWPVMVCLGIWYLVGGYVVAYVYLGIWYLVGGWVRKRG